MTFFILGIVLIGVYVLFHTLSGWKKRPPKNVGENYFSLTHQWFWEQNKPGRRFFIALVIGNILTIAVIPSYGKFISEHFLFWVGINGLLFLCLPLIWAGSNNGKIGQKFLTLLALLAVVIGVWNWASRKPSFYTKAGEFKQFLVDEDEGKVYPFEMIVAKDGSKQYPHSPATGKPLRLGKPEDIERLGLDKSLLEKWMPEVEAPEVEPDEPKTVQKVLSGRSFILEAPPAPNWSRPLAKTDILGFAWEADTPNNPKGELRILNQEGEIVFVSNDKTEHFSGNWVGLRFQSTSNIQEPIIFSW